MSDQQALLVFKTRLNASEYASHIELPEGDSAELLALHGASLRCAILLCRLRTLMGLARVASTLARPLLARLFPWCLGVSAFGAFFAKFSLGRWTLALAALLGFTGLAWVFEVLHARAHPAPRAAAGLHVKQGSLQHALLQRCSFYGEATAATLYKAPWYLWSGDAATIMSAVASSVPLVSYQRFFVPCVRGHYEVDWTFPRQCQACRAAVLLAGVGGDSEAPYVRDMARRLICQGYAVCVLLAGSGSRALSTADHLHDAADQSDLAALVDVVAEIFADVVLVGFSMGAIAVNHYLGCHSAAVPRNVRGAMSISGAFKVDFMSWARYENLYQRLIVPNLLCKILPKNGCEIRERLGAEGFQKLIASSTYADLHENLYSPLQCGRHHDNVVAWRRALGGIDSRGDINVPLLMVSALDEPLHHPDMIGFETEPNNGNVAYLITNQGGHVGWPQGAPPFDFQFTGEIAIEYFRQCIELQLD